MRHELGGARVIDAFHADDLLRQLRIVLADMFDQRGLGVGRAGDKDRTGIGDRLRDRMQCSRGLRRRRRRRARWNKFEDRGCT